MAQKFSNDPRAGVFVGKVGSTSHTPAKDEKLPDLKNKKIQEPSQKEVVDTDSEEEWTWYGVATCQPCRNRLFK